MKIEVEKIDIQNISRDDAIQILNEINKATGGTCFKKDEYPLLHQMYVLLNGTFRSSVNGVHFISGEAR